MAIRFIRQSQPGPTVRSKIMFCENCGKKLPDDAKVCENCGYKTASAAVPEKPQQPQQPAQAQQPQQQPQPQQPQPQPQPQQPQPQYRTNNTQQIPVVPPQTNYQNQQQANYNPGQQPYNQQYSPYSPNLALPMTVGDFILTFFLLAIPIVNIILVFVWAFGESVNQNKKNMAKAVLILMVIGVVISIAMGILFATFFSTLDSVISY